MIEFGPFGALRIILFLLVVFYLFRWYNRSKQQKASAGQGQPKSRYDKRTRHGDVTVEYNKDGSRKTSSRDSGEYVDFEEVD